MRDPAVRLTMAGIVNQHQAAIRAALEAHGTDAAQAALSTLDDYCCHEPACEPGARCVFGEPQAQSTDAAEMDALFLDTIDTGSTP